MEYLSNFSNCLSLEINQNNRLQQNLLISILSSRRMLADHLDILEEAFDDCMKQNKIKSNEKITLINTSGAILVSYAAYSYFQNSYVIPCLSSAFPLLYIRKRINIQQRKGNENVLVNLIKAFDEFESGVKKTISFINDAQVMDTYARILHRYDRRNQIPFHLVDTIKRVIRAIYCFTKYLEYYYKLDPKLKCLYQEIDDVDNCDLMRLYKDEWDIKTIREFFSLFAYVQSYALLRLGLIFASSIDDTKHLLKMKVNDMTMKIKLQSTRIPGFLELVKNMQRFKEGAYEKLREELAIQPQVNKEFRMILNDALDVSIQAFSYDLQTQELHGFISDLIKKHEKPDKKSIDDLLNRLEIISNQISRCHDEQNRLAIAVKKYLNKEDEDDDEKLISPEKHDEHNVIKTIKEDDKVEPQKDEFFYIDPSKNDDNVDIADNKKSEDSAEEHELQIQITKQCFKPVLLQLKEKIGPIGENMKEREKKVLKEKGIDIKDEPLLSSSDHNKMTDLKGSDDERERKILRSRSKFNESRELLMSKKPFSIFEASKPIPIKQNGYTEEILE